MAVHTHKVEIVPVVLEKHPDADRLSIVHVYNWQVVTRTSDWGHIPKVGAYIQPDSIVDVTRPEFAFLRKSPDDVKPQRIRVVRLRKALSQGLLIPAPPGFQIGDDAAEFLGVRHYEPPSQDELDARGGESASAEAYTGPQVWVPTYDVESMYRWASCFREGELVYVSEKLDGQNAKFMFDGERMWAGTRKEWKKPGMGTPWKVMEAHPWIETFCRTHPMRILFGEIFGWVQTLRYGAMPGEYWFRAFDVLEGTDYWPVEKFLNAFSDKERVPGVPTSVLGDTGRGLDYTPIVPFNFKALQALAEGETLFPVRGNTNKPGKDGKPIPNLREGIVVKPLEERYEHELGRVMLKLVSNNYLETKEE